jgi:hypothetical protein
LGIVFLEVFWGSILGVVFCTIFGGSIRISRFFQNKKYSGGFSLTIDVTWLHASSIEEASWALHCHSTALHAVINGNS